MRATDVALPAEDGTLLAGTWREPPAPRAAVVLAGATAVPARAYSRLAEALAWSGLAVLTFDYRGVGGSAPRRLRGHRATMADWGRLDLDGALAWVRERLPGAPPLLFGHSVGGQLLGLAPNAEALRGALLVGAQSGYWRHWPGGARYWMWLNWHLVLPGISLVLGYAPMGVLGMGENLPAGVARQWARWGRHPEHLLSECSPRERERYARLGFPIRAYHLSDDGFAPREAVQRLLGFYRGAPTELVSRSPAELGVPSIGHFGWLRPQHRDTLWREMADWFLARADAVSGRAVAQANPDVAHGPQRRDADVAQRAGQRPLEPPAPSPR
jgi:predicted alpha/beta hydrolase